MTNKNKTKGTSWERQLVELLEDRIDGCRADRVAGSGALGTTMHEPLLTGDVVMSAPGFLPRKFKIEAKVGYGGATQITVQKLWIDKILGEARMANAIPALAIKFLGSKKVDGVQYAIILDIDTFCDIINYVTKLQKELEKHE
jgi:Holliday junction resolvase